MCTWGADFIAIYFYSFLEVHPLTMVVVTGSSRVIVLGMQQCAGMFGHLHFEKPAKAWCM